MIGYMVRHKPELASYRLRVDLPSQHLGMDYVIGDVGDLTFFYKLGNPDIARQCPVTVFDVVNDHFDTYPTVLEMANLATVVTAGSAAMAEKVRLNTGREDVAVIDDPYENEEREAKVRGDTVLWFGHSVNLPSLARYDLRNLKLLICSNAQGASPWSLENEALHLERCAVVLMTGTNPGASSNRIVKSLRAGRFVVAPPDCAESWKDFEQFIWIGDIRRGISWALNNREEACSRIKAGQEYVRSRYSPAVIGSQWASLFASTLARAT